MQTSLPDENELQQFCEALTPPPSGKTFAPQMLPAGLQLPPLSQRLPPQSTLLIASPPPQHSFVAPQYVPVIRQPLAGKQTFAPEPGSKQMREQQPVPLVQGLPSCVQPPPPPPVTVTQRPTPPSFPVEQTWPQHSSLVLQMSSLGWQ